MEPVSQEDSGMREINNFDKAYDFYNNMEVAYDLTYWLSKWILMISQTLTFLGGLKWQNYLKFWRT
jgi:hypothetical protein